MSKPVDFIYRFDPEHADPKPMPATAEAARLMLENGSQLFAQWLDRCSTGDQGVDTSYVVPFHPQDPGLAHASGTATKQAPYAVLLGCSDARVPAELLFGASRNNLFVVRVAGNVLSDECLGSIEYALGHLRDSLRLVVVLGHTGCGAVQAAVDTYLNPWAYLEKSTTHGVRSLVDRLFVPVRKAANALENVWGPDAAQQPKYREALVETAVFINAAQASFNLGRELEVARIEEIKACYGVFDLLTHRVWSLPEHDPQTVHRDWHLAAAPTHLDAFEELAIRMAFRMVRKVSSPTTKTIF